MPQRVFLIPGTNRFRAGMRIFFFGGLLAVCPAFLLAQTWTTVGMGGGGAQYAPSISPLNSNLRFVGCDMSGWYRSADGGNTWNMLDFYQISTEVDYDYNDGVMCPMAFHPTNADIVYGFGAQQDTQLNSPNLLVSNDGGQTWSVVPGANPAPWPAWGNTGGRVTIIYVDRGDANFILIGTDNGVWVSVNGGTSFNATTGTSGYVSGFMVDQSSPVGNRTCYVGTSAGVFKSANEGSSWTAANTGLSTPANVLSFTGASTGTAGGTRLFAIDGNSNELYTSTNASAWALSSSADTFSMVAGADNDINTAYATNNYNRTVWQTANGGTSWSQVFADVSPVANLFDGWIDYDLSFSGWGSPVDGLGVNSANSSQVIFSDLGETFKSDTAGVSWTEGYTNYDDTAPMTAGQKWSSRGLEVTSVFQYAFDPNNSNYNYLCASDIGFCYSSDSGATWHNTARSNDGSFPSGWTETFYHVAFNTTAGTVFAAVSGLHDLDHSDPLDNPSNLEGGVIKSTNYGGTWTSSSTGLPSAPDTSIVYDSVNQIFYTALWGKGVYKSTNNGASWTTCATQPFIGTNKDVYSLEMVGGNLYCLLSAQSGYANPGGLFVSANGGGSWTNITTNVTGGPLYYPTDFDVNPSNPATIFIAAQDSSQTQGGCYRTTNGGTSWTLMTIPVPALYGIPNHTPYGFAPSINPANPTNVYYGTENQGFFQTTDDGNTWARVTTLPFSSIQHVNFGNNAMYVGTFGGGVWKMAIGTTTTPTATPSSTATNSSTATRTNSPTATPTASATNTMSATPTLTPTNTATNTSAITSTFTNTATNTPTSTAMNSATHTSTSTATNTSTLTPAMTSTFTNTATNTASSTATHTPTNTASSTATNSSTSTPTNSSTRTATNTATVTSTYSHTNTPTLTSTNTPTNSATSSVTNQSTLTPTNTPTVTPTYTPTLSSIIVISAPYPNPSNGVPISFNLQATGLSTVTMDVFTLSFRKVTSQTTQISGYQTLQWDLKDRTGDTVSNGLYYVRLRVTGGQTVAKIQKVLILR